MKIFLVGVKLFYAGLIFNFVTTWYFGWNLRPQSPEEMICDYIAVAAMAGGLIIQVYAWMVKPVSVQNVGTLNILGNTTFIEQEKFDKEGGGGT